MWKSNKFFLHKSPPKTWFGMEFTACEVELMPEGALTSFTVCDAYRYYAGHALLSTVGHAQNI